MKKNELKKQPPNPNPIIEQFRLFLIYCSDTFSIHLKATGLNGGKKPKIFRNPFIVIALQ